MLLTELPVLDDLLQAHAAALGADFTPYRNHCYRVVNLCVVQSVLDRPSIEKVEIAAAFHDLGIWTAHTFDYLPPSIQLARSYLREAGRTADISEISTMILEHHKISPYREMPGSLVEPFRRADWVDVTRGVVSWGLPGERIREIVSTWPSAGFHRRLVQLELSRLRTHPWNPLPMVKL